MNKISPAAKFDNERPSTFTRKTQRGFAALRFTAYFLATLFMIVMIARGIWLTRDQMEAEADRSIQSAALAVASVAPSKSAEVLHALSPVGVSLKVGSPPKGDQLKNPEHFEIRVVKLADGQSSLIAMIDHAAIWQAAIDANLGYIAFVAALGLPVIVIFLYMGWLVNRPALQLLAFAQSAPNSGQALPRLPKIWRSVVERLSQFRDSQAHMQAFLDNSPFTMFVTELDGTFVLTNNYVREEHEGEHVRTHRAGENERDHSTPEWTALVADMDRCILETGEAQRREDKVETGGEPIYVALIRFPIRSANGAIERIGSIVFDMNEQKRTEAMLAEQQAQLHQSEKLAALGQLLAGVAHELNNPLAIVLGRAAILKDKLAGSPHADSIQKLRDAADRCARIVRTFLAMARQTGPRREVVQINELIKGSLDMTAYGLRTAEIELVQQLDPALPLIEADEDQIVQLMINLIVNAQHALEGHDGNRKLVVTTRLDAVTERVMIEVADTGPGVPGEVASRIFEPFFTTKEVGAGTGLGLSVSKGLVEAHGGTLTLHPTAGGGATFRATLPVLKGAVRAVIEDPQAHGAMKGHVLVIDDEPEIAAILADCLTPLGLTCEIAGDGLAALELIGQRHVDAIFCDVRMPGMDGITFLAMIKAKHPELAARLAFVSGDMLRRDVQLIEAASDRPIIEKPFDPQVVRDVATLLLAPAGDPQ